MMEEQCSETESSILYELLTLAEWTQNVDAGFQKITASNYTPSSSIFPWGAFKKSKIDQKRYLQAECAWQLAVSQDGKVVAILQETHLEIRTAKDEYSTVVGKAAIPQDQYPQLRRLTWSPDNTFVAVARDNGTVNVYNLLGCNIAAILPEGTANNNNSSNIIKPVVGLLFLQPKFKSTKWSNELVVVYHSGEIRSILLSSLDGCDHEENAKLSVEEYFPRGISSVAYHSFHHALIIAGPPQAKQYGMSVWRILNDYPYLKVACGFEKTSAGSRSIFRFLRGYSTSLDSNTVIKMKIAPNGEILACIHHSGDISLWRLPGIMIIKRWSLFEQPDYGKLNPESVETVQDQEYFHPVDISWWSNSALVVARRSGAVSVCSILSLKNLLGDSPEFLSRSPQISSIYGNRSAVIALECEVTDSNRKKKDDYEETESDHETSVLHASIQAALYSFTDIERFEPKRKTPRIATRTYRLLALKRTTPEELYSRKIEFEDYGTALILAHTYNLDCDLVYQKQWRSSTVSKESIYDFLDKIKNTFWVLNECIERVPDTVEACKELLDFGLMKTNFNSEVTLTNSSFAQKEIASLRKQILSYSDSLSLYQRIIGDPKNYNADNYDQFRRRSAIMNTVNFARQENWLAVSIMFTYSGNDILPHWLPILSNIPETLHPKEYSSLLPEIIDGEVIKWEVKQLRSPDWSEGSDFKNNSEWTTHSSEFIYESDPSLKYFCKDVLTPQLVEEWYIRRTYEIEKNTGLVEYALSFATLGKERNVNCLSPLLFNLLTLHSLVYVVQDLEVTLSKLEALNHLEQAMLLLSKTTKSTFIKDLKNVIRPFASRCEDSGSATFFSLLREILMNFSKKNLELPLEFLKHIKEDTDSTIKLYLTETMSLALDCIYTCPHSDQVENGYLILECLPVRGTSMTVEEEKLHDEIDKLEKHLEVCDILERYKVSKSLLFMRENEENKSSGMELMRDMCKYTKEESLNFDDLLYDLQRVQSSMFTCLEPGFCSELVAFSQLTCECEEIILSAEELLQCKRDESDKAVPFDRSIQLILEAARIHFERATDYNDASIKLSLACLNLANEPHPEIYEELDLIESLQLLQDFNVKLLPIQVRKFNDKIKLISKCLEADRGAYKACQRLLQLAHTLRIYGEDRKRREGEVLILIAKHALTSLDFQYCSEICNRLITRNFSPAWTVVRALAEENCYENDCDKKELFAFAMLHCPAENLEELIEYRTMLHTRKFPTPDVKSLALKC